MRDDHPIDRLVVTVQGTVSASVADSMGALSQQWDGRRQWLLGQPELFDGPDVRNGRSLVGQPHFEICDSWSGRIVERW
jgi:hypothetical protein